MSLGLKRSQLITGSGSPGISVDWVDWFRLLLSSHVNLLAAEPELLVETPVALDILFAQIIEQTLPTADELEESAGCGMVAFICLEMLGDLTDPCRKHRHLDLWRARVVTGPGMLRDYLLLLSGF